MVSGESVARWQLTPSIVSADMFLCDKITNMLYDQCIFALICINFNGIFNLKINNNYVIVCKF